MKEYLRLVYGSSILARALLRVFGIRFETSYLETQAQAREYARRHYWNLPPQPERPAEPPVRGRPAVPPQPARPAEKRARNFMLVGAALIVVILFGIFH
jgi:hypothetical protein